MKVIFLDIDGVLNTAGSPENGGELIDHKKVEALSGLVEKTGAVVVLSSGWKLMFDSEMRPLTGEATLLFDAFLKFGVSIYGKTPDFSTEEIRKTRAFSKVKANEIKAWLDARSDIESFVVIDDLYLNDEIIDSRRVRVNGAAGLSDADIKLAADMLSADIQQNPEINSIK